MTLVGLAVRNLARNKLRAGLTTVGIAVAVVGFLVLRTFMWAWVASSQNAPVDRIVTRNKITFAVPLPKRYVDSVVAIPHVKAATWSSGFGGRDPRHPDALFGSLAADARTFFTVFTDMSISDREMDAFVHDRRGAVVGDVIAKSLGWKLGDEVVLESGFYPGQWRFKIDGIYTAAAKSVNGSNFILRWDFLNDALPPERPDKDTVGFIVSRPDDAARSAEVAMAIDKLFEEGEVPTLSQDERTVSAAFLGMYSAVLDAANIVSIVVLCIVTLILGNTIAMAVRERTSEYGVLRTMGFLSWHLALWVVGESLLLGLAGGVLGAALSWPVIDLFVRRVLEAQMGAFFPYFELHGSHALLAIGLAATLGAAAAGLPAWRASRLRVVDAIRRAG